MLESSSAAAAKKLERSFRAYALTTQAVINSKPPEYFGLPSHDHVLECACNAIKWCYANMDDEPREKYQEDVQVALDLLNTVRFSPGRPLGRFRSPLPPPLQTMLVFEGT